MTQRRLALHVSRCGFRSGLEELISDRNPHFPQSFHVYAESLDQKEYFLHCEIHRRASLEALDSFLRGIWVDCCSHNSAFTIGKVRYTQAFERDPSKPFLEQESKTMGNARADQLFRKGLKFSYSYDAAHPTEIALRVVGDCRSSNLAQTVSIMARNEPPKHTCSDCDQPASRIMDAARGESRRWLCRGCAPRYPPAAVHPAANSPRAGICSFDGELGALRFPFG